MNYWLVKSEPESYSWEDLQSKGEDIWDGIRNYQARNYLKEMKVGDQVLFYHSGKTKEIVGLAKVSMEAFPDPNDKEQKGWMAVKLVPSKSFPKPLQLEQIKSDDLLNGMVLLKQSRLSVMPLEKPQFEHIIKITS